MKALLSGYNSRKLKSLEDIIELHQRFESIHPFQDGNGRVGRLIMFKECLANGHVPFIITEDLKFFYYRGLKEWNNVRGYLIDTCLAAQDNFKAMLDYFRRSNNDIIVEPGDKGLFERHNFLTYNGNDTGRVSRVNRGTQG